MVIAVVNDGHDRAGVDQDHAAVPGGSVRRISSLRSARSGSAESVRSCLASRCAWSPIRPASNAARSISPIAATRSSGTPSSRRCISSLVAMT
jgi:hypothetical protein